MRTRNYCRKKSSSLQTAKASQECGNPFMFKWKWKMNGKVGGTTRKNVVLNELASMKEFAQSYLQFASNKFRSSRKHWKKTYFRFYVIFYKCIERRKDEFLLLRGKIWNLILLLVFYCNTTQSRISTQGFGTARVINVLYIRLNSRQTRESAKWSI